MITGVLQCTSFFITFTSLIYLVGFWQRKKLTARFQARLGPSSMTALWLQGTADFMKLYAKQDPISEQPKGFLLLCLCCGLFGTMFFMPFHEQASFLDFPLSPFIMLLGCYILRWSVYVIKMGQNTPLPWMIELHGTMQTLLASILAILAILSIYMQAGTLAWSEIIAQQGFYPWNWFLLRSPWCCYAGMVYWLAGGAMLGLPPFEGSFHVQSGIEQRIFPIYLSCSGRGFLFFLAGHLYCNLFWCLTGVSLFLGGWALPAWLESILQPTPGIKICLQLALVIFKVRCIVFCYLWVVQTLPKASSMQWSEWMWKIILPAFMTILCLQAATLILPKVFSI